MTAIAAVTVVNGDFEADAELWDTMPGYVGGDNPSEITGWTGTGLRGINPVVPGTTSDSPFDDPSGWNTTRFAFLHRNANILQTITGFSMGSRYVLGFDYNARGCCDGILPIGIVNIWDFGNGLDLHVISPFHVVPVAEDPAPWHHVELGFTARAQDMLVNIISRGPEGLPDADFALVLDNIRVSLAPEPNIPEPRNFLLILLSTLLGLGRTRNIRPDDPSARR